MALKLRNDVLDSWLIDHLQVIHCHVGHVTVPDLGPYLSLACFYFEIVLKVFVVHFRSHVMSSQVGCIIHKTVSQARSGELLSMRFCLSVS